MDPAAFYDYLVRARRDLFARLAELPPEFLSRRLLHGQRLHCIKDLLFHMAAVEDDWLHCDILRTDPVVLSFQGRLPIEDGPAYADVPLELLKTYWEAVEQRMRAFLADYTPARAGAVVQLHDDPSKHFRTDGIVWHVMTHEVRHSAQIALLLRTEGHAPPKLDLYYYLPNEPA
ncbi:MAG: DinB family protein [Planctomycetota bacterium]